MPETRFQIAEVFRTSDPVSLWALGMAMVCNDVILTNRFATQAWDESGDQPSPEGLYFFRLAASHYREAAKFQKSWEAHGEVIAFIQRLPSQVQDDYSSFKGSFDPWENSFVHDVLKPVRDQLFHYIGPNDEQIGGALAELDSTAGLYRSGNTIATLRAEFADDVVSQLAFGSHQSREELTTTLMRLASLMTALLRFSEAVVTLFLRDRGVIQGGV